jgi:hypothetical protein
MPIYLAIPVSRWIAALHSRLFSNISPLPLNDLRSLVLSGAIYALYAHDRKDIF